MTKLGGGLLLLAGSIGSMVGCAGKGSVGEAVTPEAITASDALGEEQANAPIEPRECLPIGKRSDPLIVDLSPSKRVDIEAALQEGIAVVRYDCNGLELLRDCQVPGSYGFKGVTTKERVLQLNTAGEVHANLPITGGSLAVELGAELNQGASLDLALIMIGKMRSVDANVPQSAVESTDCEGATHFIRGATVGALAMAQGTAGNVSSVASVFKASAGAQSKTEKLVSTIDGNPDACKKATAKGLEAPDQCGALLRLELKAFVDGVKKTEDSPADDVDYLHCPDGYVEREGKCVEEGAPADRVCDRKNLEDCQGQCDAGNTISCEYASLLLEKKQQFNKAFSLHEKACKGGVLAGCHNVAYAYFAGGRGTDRDPKKSYGLWERNCDEGFIPSCSGLGLLYEEGAGVEKDLTKAASYYEMACTAGDMVYGCPFFGKLLASGSGVEKDAEKAKAILDKACSAQSHNGCVLKKKFFTAE